MLYFDICVFGLGNIYCSMIKLSLHQKGGLRIRVFRIRSEHQDLRLPDPVIIPPDPKP